MMIFNFFERCFLTSELKSEDTFVLRRVRAFYFVGFSLSIHALSPLHMCTVKTFQPPSDRYPISDSGDLLIAVV